MYAKQGRAAVYKNAKERDDALKKEIKDIEAGIKKHEAQVRLVTLITFVLICVQIADLDKEIKTLKDTIKKTGKDISDKHSGQEATRTAIDDSQKKYLEIKDRRDRAANDRK